MRILFMHNNFPGQYRRIAEYLKKNTKYQMGVSTLETNKQQYNLAKATYKPHREPREGTHPALIATERAVIMGQAAYETLTQLKKKTGSPDIILAHSGWGASMFVKDVFPDAKLLSYFEWYYHSRDSDSSFITGEDPDPNDQLRIRVKNTPILHDLAAMDWGQCPTAFQHSRFPDLLQKKMSVLHDGVDTDYFVPDDDVKVNVGNNIILSKEDEVVTYVARGMEEYRGFPQFMEIVAKLQKKRPNMHAVILGNDRVAYGAPRKDGKTFKEWALETYDFDMSRLHFMGLQPLQFFRALMQISSAHVYLTAPFVLSWSMLEAMSTGALIIGSDTEPVQELIEDGHNGLIVPFFNTEKIAKSLESVLNNPHDYKELRQNARQTILDNYSTMDLLPKYQQLIENVANGTQI
jgi:glycosyltransferase involved in cell wall biosynthesis